MGVEACEKILPKVPNVAVFDTPAFHIGNYTKPPFLVTPYEWYENYKLRRYGFLRTSLKMYKPEND